MAKRVRIGLVGSGGRLGSKIVELAGTELSKRVEISIALERGTAPSIEAAAEKVDVFLDVSSPEAAAGYLTKLKKKGSPVAYVVGCTGWSAQQMKAVSAYASVAPLVLAPNFAPGVNLMLGLLERAAPLLKDWGYDVIVHETHHTRKVDSPSGTAKAIVEALGDLKPQIHASRAGNIVGTHEVRFVGPGDVLSIEHEALDRAIFARGALLGAEWASRQTKPGLYSMRDVIFGSD